MLRAKMRALAALAAAAFGLAPKPAPVAEGRRIRAPWPVSRPGKTGTAAAKRAAIKARNVRRARA